MNAPKSASQINSGTILLAFVAIMVGLGGTYAMRVFTRKVEEVAKPPEKAKPVLTTVPLASRDILSGTELTLDDVALFKMTPEDIKKRFPGVSFMTNPSQIIGKIALNEIKQGQPFNTQDFFPLKKGPGVVKRLQPGLRALTLVLNKTDALLGFAGPGQRVDVLFNYGTDSAAGINKAGSKGIFFNHFLYNPPRVRDYRATRSVAVPDRSKREKQAFKGRRRRWLRTSKSSRSAARARRRMRPQPCPMKNRSR